MRIFALLIVINLVSICGYADEEEPVNPVRSPNFDTKSFSNADERLASDTETSNGVKYVDTLVGTLPWQGPVTVAGPERAEGHTYPGVCVPFGMTEWTPQTTTEDIPYWYHQSSIQGFRGTHYPSGAVMREYGSVTIMPLVGELHVLPSVRASKFAHERETAKPHYYAVMLADYGIEAEVTATTRAGFFKFAFPRTAESYILIDARRKGVYIEIFPDKSEVVGWNSEEGWGTAKNFAGYFVAKFDKPFSSYGTWYEKGINPDSLVEEGSGRLGAYVKYATDPAEVIKVKVGTSFISIEQARKNLNNEIPDWDFDATREKARKVWNRELGKIEIKGGTPDQKVIFYTALYHCLLLPRIFSEDNRHYSPFDGKVHDGVYYNDFSLWDTFRAEHPLLILIEPERVKDMIKALVQMSDEGGWMPKWPNPGYSNVMMGTHADSVIADAYIKGVQDFDVEKAYETMRKNAMLPAAGVYKAREGLADYKELGYVPVAKWSESVARTLEFAYDDYCVAQMAQSLGKETDYKLFRQRADNYKNVFDSATGLVRGRRMDGAWAAPFYQGISVWAGNSDLSVEIWKWNYTTFIPHDVQGLVNLMGGRKAFISKLDNFFKRGWYYVGDEFSQQAPYEFVYAGAPWKTQEWVREIMDKYYATGPAGLCGNDDCGQLSAWYIFSAMGFYPVCPGQPVYVIGSPLFKRVVIHLQNGKDFVVEAEEVSAENKYIQSATLNGKPLNKPWFDHSDLMDGGALILQMGPEPNKKWGSPTEVAPPSLTPVK